MLLIKCLLSYALPVYCFASILLAPFFRATEMLLGSISYMVARERLSGKGDVPLGNKRKKIIVLILIILIVISCFSFLYFINNLDFGWSGKQYSSVQLSVKSTWDQNYTNDTIVSIAEALENNGYNVTVHKLNWVDDSDLPDPLDIYRLEIRQIDNESAGDIIFTYHIYDNSSVAIVYVNNLISLPGPSNTTEAMYNCVNNVFSNIDNTLNWDSATWGFSWMTMTSDGVDYYYGYPLSETRPAE